MSGPNGDLKYMKKIGFKINIKIKLWQILRFIVEGDLNPLKYWK